MVSVELTAVCVTVNCPGLEPASAAAASLAAMETVAESLSAMVTVAVLAPPDVLMVISASPLLILPSVTMTFSLRFYTLHH